MAKSGSSSLVISSCRGGMNDQDPAHILPDDQATLLENVEFFFSTLGERRRGCKSVSILNSGLDSSDDMVHLGVHFPQLAEIYQNELFAISATENTSINFARRDAGGLWHPITLTPSDTFDKTFPTVLRIH